jgi:uncharacterized protein YndB with AHSA1/START domain
LVGSHRSLSACFSLGSVQKKLEFQPKDLKMTKTITVQTTINAPLSKVWECWTDPKHITGWAFASNEWEAPEAENDLRVGGKFKTRMQAKDKSGGFDFAGTYTITKENKLIEYNMDDGRHVKVVFEEISDGVKVTETFDPEGTNSEDMQRSGWQAILNNFKEYVESR